MVEVVKIGAPFLGKIVDYLVDPIKRQFTYMCCFNTNITELQTQLKELETTRQDVQMGADEDRRNVRVVGQTVEAWLTRANEVTTEVEGIIQDKDKVKEGCLNGWCPNLKLRYSLSRKAVKKTKVVVDLKANGVGHIKSSYSPRPACLETITNRDFMGFESRRLMMEEIIKALKHDEINLIGVCGMGGVGKTTLVKEVANRAKEEKLFDEVAMDIVGQKPDLHNVQACIADTLGLKNLLNTKSPIERANLLHKRLLQDNKKVLVILDDIWKEFDLQAMGIPLEGADKNFKVLYTSRTRDLWLDLRTKKEIPLEILSKDEAWQLFREKAGDSADAPDLRPIAKQIVDECGCLPLALVLIGSALSKKSGRNNIKEIWEDMLGRLTCATGTPADGQLSSRLELSYQFLEDEEDKGLFLLCCLFQEDKDIRIEDLARYGLGLSLFEGINEMRKARCRVVAIVDDLKSRYLLVDGKNKKECVKVHDVVRDMGISIASKNKFALVIHGEVSEWPKKDTYEHYTSISLISGIITELPIGLTCPNLEFLLLDCKELKELPCNFFEGMGKLKVLVLNNFEGILSLPSSLRNLHTLSLSNFEGMLDNVSEFGGLFNLKTFSFRNSMMEEPLEAIGEMVNLKLLDLTDTYVERIPPGVISRLVHLEELYAFRDVIVELNVLRGFDVLMDWEGDGKEEEGRYANLRELELLSNLNTLEISIKGDVVIPKVPIFRKLKIYKVFIKDDELYDWNDDRDKEMDDEKKMDEVINFVFGKCKRWLLVISWIPIPLNRGGIDSLLRSSDLLFLEGEGCNDLVQTLLLRDGVDGLQQLKLLRIRSCDTPECLVNTRNSVHLPIAHAPAIFPILEVLDLRGLVKLREICGGPVPACSFGELTFIRVQKCGRLRNLFQLPIVGCLPQLKCVIIRSCDTMEEVFCKDQQEDVHAATNRIEFPKLEVLKLEKLPSLMRFCRGIDQIDFPQLKELCLEDIPQVNLLFHNSCNLSTNSLFPEKVSLPNLEVLRVGKLENLERLEYRPLSVGSFSKLNKISLRDCGKLLCVIPSQFLLMLRELQELTVESCNSLEVVFELEGLESNEPNPEIENLERLGHGPLSVGSFSKLNKIFLRDCGKLLFVIPSQFLPMLRELQELTVESCNSLEVVFELEGLEFNEPNSEILSQLKFVNLRDLPKLNCISKRGRLGTKYIQTLEIRNCNSLRYVFAPTRTTSIPQLRELKVSSCEMLSRIVAEENGLGESSVDEVEFPQLESLELLDLPKLLSFFPNVNVNTTILAKSTDHYHNPMQPQPLFNEKVAIPSLKYLELSGLETVSDLWCSELPTSSFSNLKTLNVRGFTNLRSTFHPSIVGGLANLSELVIRDCSKMEGVVYWEEEIEDGQGSKVEKTLFPLLRKLQLSNLPNLVSFFPNVNVNTTTLAKSNDHLYNPMQPQPLFNEKVAFPCLKYLELSGLQNVSDLWGSELPTNSFSKLKNLQVTDLASLRNKVCIVWINDLNNTTQGLQENQRKEEEELDEDEDEEDQEEVARLLYYRMYGGDSVLALGSNGTMRCWDWGSGEHNPFGKVTTKVLPSRSHLATTNDVTGVNLEEAVPCMALSTNFSLILACGGAISLVDRSTLRVMRTFMPPPPASTFLAFYPRKFGIIAIGMEDSTIRIYNRCEDKVIKSEMKGHKKHITGLAFSTNLNILVSSGADAQLCIWRIDTWEHLKSVSIPLPAGKACNGDTRVQFHYDQICLLVSHETQLAIYDASEMDRIRQWVPQDVLSAPISFAVYSGYSLLVYTSFCDGNIGVFDADSLTLACRIVPSIYLPPAMLSGGQAMYPRVVAAHPEKPYKFAIGFTNGSVMTMEPQESEGKWGLSPSTVDNGMLNDRTTSSSNTSNHTPNQVARLLYTNYGDGVLTLWSNGTMTMRKWPSGMWQPANGLAMTNDVTGVNVNEAVPCVALSKGDVYIISACGGAISLVDTMTFTVRKRFMPPPPASTFLAFHPDAYNIIAIGMEDSTICIYNYWEDEVKSKLKGHKKRITGLAFSTNLNILVSSAADAQLCIWRIDTWEHLKSVSIPLPAGKACNGDTRVQFHSDQIRLLVSHETQLAIYDASEMDRIRQWVPQDVLPAPISFAVYSCDSQLVYASFCDANIGVFDADSLTLACRIVPSTHLLSGGHTVYPRVIAAHSKKDEFVIGLANRVVGPIKCRESEGKRGLSPAVDHNGMLNDRTASSSNTSNHTPHQNRRKGEEEKEDVDLDEDEDEDEDVDENENENENEEDQNGDGPMARSMEKPKTLDDVTDKSKPRKVAETQCQLVVMPDSTDEAHKVAHLLYKNGCEVLALGCNGALRLWRRYSSINNQSGKATASVVPQQWQPASGLAMTNDVTGVNLEEAVPCMALSKNYSNIISACGGAISLFDARTLEVMTKFMSPLPSSTFLAFHPQDDKIIAIGMEDSTICVRNYWEDWVVSELKGHKKRITGLAFSTNLNILVSSGADAQFCIWRIDTWEHLKSVPIQLPAGKVCNSDTTVQFHSDQIRLLVSHETQLVIYDASKMDRIRQWVPQDVLPAPISFAAYSCDGQIVYTSFCDGNIGVFDADSLTLKCHILPSAYFPTLSSGSQAVYPTVVATHPWKPNQFAIGLTNGSVILIEPPESEGKWGLSPTVYHKGMLNQKWANQWYDVDSDEEDEDVDEEDEDTDVDVDMEEDEDMDMDEDKDDQEEKWANQWYDVDSDEEDEDVDEEDDQGENGVGLMARSMEKPRTLDDVTDKPKPWKVAETQCQLVGMPNSIEAQKVARLLYTNYGNDVIALGSNGTMTLWKWDRSQHNPSREQWRPASGLAMTNEVTGVNLEEAVPCMALSKNEAYIISACGGKVSLFNILTFSVMATFMPPPPASTFLAFFPEDNNIIAIGMEDSTIRIYNVREDELKSELKGHKKRIAGLAFSTKLNKLVSSGADAQLCIWSIDTWEKLKSVPIQLLAGTACNGDTRVQFHSNQIRLLVSHETQLAIYDASEMDCILQWVPQDVLLAPISFAAFSCDSQLVYTSFSDGNIGVFDADNLTLTHRIAPSAYSPTLSSGSHAVYPLVVATHPFKPNQFAIGLTNGSVIIMEPQESEGKWGLSSNMSNHTPDQKRKKKEKGKAPQSG